MEKALMARVLALTSRLPYPPREGHQLRSWHLLRGLAREHEVTLLSFVRDDDAPEQCAELRHVLAGLEMFPIRSARSRIALALALARGVAGRRPFVVEKYTSPAMRARVAEIASQVDLIHIDMLPLAAQVGDTDLPIVLNAHNVEHELLERRIEIEPRQPQRLFLGTQLHKLKTYEREVCRRSSRILACSQNDARQFEALAPHTPVAVVPNGVDTAANQPGAGRPAHPAQLVFVGQMGWFPNRDGVDWFLAEVFPRIVQARPDVEFLLVGKTAGLQVPPTLSKNVKLAGFVDDLSVAIRGAAVYVVPLRAGSGTRLKVLEAMSFAKAMVTTHIGAEGIELQHGRDALFADSAQDFATAVLQLLADADLSARLGAAARETAIAHYDWNAITAAMLPVYAQLLDRANHK
jgi:polysaccharide biosynthesis protein PslH